jgi:tetratricopeptide (TPR) repeat protein
MPAASGGAGGAVGAAVAGPARVRFAGLDTRAWTGVVFGVALLVRVVYLVDISGNPFFRTPVIDAEFYHQQAQSLARGEPLAPVPFQMPPLFPFVLGIVYRLTGGSLVAAHVLQVLFGSGTAALAFALGRRAAAGRLGARLGIAAGLVAAGFAATSKALLFVEGDLLATPLAVFLDVLGLWFLARWSESAPGARHANGHLAAAGVVFGLSALAMPQVLVCVPVFAVWIAWRRRRPLAGAVFLLMVALPILPVALRNLRASGEWVPISANGGINLWMGNNPDWRRTSTLRPGPEWRAMQELPMRAGVIPSSDRDRWFQRQAFGFWTAQPGAALRAFATKAWMLVHDHEIMRDVDPYFFASRYSRVQRLPGWSFSWLLGLAVVGLVWVRRKRVLSAGGLLVSSGTERVLHIFLASYAAGIVLFFVASRYRAPLLPVLAVFAGAGGVWLAVELRARRWRAAVPAVAALVAAVVVSEVDLLGVDRIDIVEAEYRVATTFDKQGRWADALALYDANLARDPNHALSAVRAAVCAERLGRAQEAVDRYEALLERRPDYAEAAVNLGHLASRAGDRGAAEHYYQRAVAAAPYMPQAHAAYGQFLLQVGDAAGAVAGMERALLYDPTWTLLRVDYASALLRIGATPAARREIEAAAAVMPSSPHLELVRGDVLAAEGDFAGARAAWERGLRLAPADPELTERLRGR